ncbi:MAG: primosomal protein N' [Candidatus Gracilibacteria bacterium]
MFADILLPIANQGAEKPLTYAVPEELKTEIQCGSTVTVPLRNRSATGIVVKIHNEKPSFAVKPILRAKQDEPLLNSWQIQLATWMANYYFSPLYQTLKIMLPPSVWNPKKKTPYTIYYERTDTPISLKLGQKQLELIKLFDQHPRLSREALQAFSSATLKSLEQKNLIQKSQGEIRYVDHAIPLSKNPILAKTLTPPQQYIVDEILKTNDEDAKKFLIHGITGSGKTEIYLTLAKAVVEQGKQALLLAPEIALTPQLIDYFSHTFRGRIAVLHSALGAGEREREWWRIRKGEADVVIGSRSSIFAPVSNPGLILIDEEHEWSYKQDRTPFYHARTVAFEISKLTGAKIVMGSATPSLETRYMAIDDKPREGMANFSFGRIFKEEDTRITHPSGRLPCAQGENLPTAFPSYYPIRYFPLKERIHGTLLPHVHIADMREELHKKNFSLFSDVLLEKLKATFDAKKQAILFLNRRGHASAVLCRECGFVMKCRSCDVALTHHQFKTGEKLVCHHCGLYEKVPVTCPQCQSVAIKFIGAGTERVEQELQKLFPTLRILRADRDTTGKKGSFKSMYYALKDKEADVLIGTQMVSKGLDLPDVALVGVMLADIGLHIPDFRASERIFQLLTQVAGRAGRKHDQGEVVIQTYNPEHMSLRFASTHDYDGFFDQEVTNRKSLKYPPFSRIIKLTFKDDDQKKCSTEAERVAKELQALDTQISPLENRHTISAAPAFLMKKFNRYRWHVYIQGPTPSTLLRAYLSQTRLKKDWTIDVDPGEMG